MSGFDSAFKSEAREVRRLEVINGALGRRRWSPGAKRAISASQLARVTTGAMRRLGPS